MRAYACVRALPPRSRASEHLKASEPWFRKHPLRDEIVATGGEKVIPYRLFGDDGGIGDSRKIVVLHWIPIISNERSTRRSRLPLYVANADTVIPNCSEMPLQAKVYIIARGAIFSKAIF